MAWIQFESEISLIVAGEEAFSPEPSSEEDRLKKIFGSLNVERDGSGNPWVSSLYHDAIFKSWSVHVLIFFVEVPI